MAFQLRACSGVLLIGACILSAANSDSIYQEGMRALAAGDYQTALGRLEAALTADPDSLRFGSEYRQAIIRAKDYDRGLRFFETLVAAAPKSSNAFLNYGFAYVDKIPAAGSITQVILANTALSNFTKSIEIKPTWIGYYTRGNSYLFWPKIFGRAPLGVADLEKAMQMQKSGPKKSYHVRAYVSLGDAYWKIDKPDKARAVWKEGLAEFPNSAGLKDRLAREGDDLKAYLDDVLDPAKRVDTNLQDLWMNP